MSIPESLVGHSLPPHPWKFGQTFYSPGAHLYYRVIGPCCRLFDREQLPWPCCRLQWHGKEPSWRRIGKRFVPDMATKNSPSYSVQIVDQGGQQSFVTTLYTVKLSPQEREWWFSRKQSPDERREAEENQLNLQLHVAPKAKPQVRERKHQPMKH